MAPPKPKMCGSKNINNNKTKTHIQTYENTTLLCLTCQCYIHMYVHTYEQISKYVCYKRTTNQPNDNKTNNTRTLFFCQSDVKCGGDVQQLICPIVWTEIQSKQTEQETAVPYLNSKRLIVCRQIHILTYTLAHKR